MYCSTESTHIYIENVRVIPQYSPIVFTVSTRHTPLLPEYNIVIARVLSPQTDTSGSIRTISLYTFRDDWVTGDWEIRNLGTQWRLFC